MTLIGFRWLTVSLALLLLAVQPAAADNYTSRSDRQAESASVTLPEEPEPLPAELPPLNPVPVSAEPLSEKPTSAPAPVAAPAAAPATPVPAAPKLEKIWLEGQLPEGAQTEGEWIWDADPAAGAAAVHSHPSRNGMQNHRFTAAEPMEMPGNGMIVQQVWLDPQDPPQGIALRFKLASGEEVGVYWEGEKELFTPTEYEELWYYGMLPELGRWISLEILAEDLGLDDTRIAGVTFSTFDGRVLWGKTVLTEAPPLEGEEEEEE